MIFRIIGHEYNYETRNVVGLFFPGEKVEITGDEGEGEYEITSRLSGDECSASIIMDGKKDGESIVSPRGCEEEYLCRALFILLKRNTGISPPWGMLTGVRPVKQIVSCKGRGLTDEESLSWIREHYFTDEKKLKLCLETYYGEEKIKAMSLEDGYSLYVSIPFCPTRCSYCSFVSHGIETAGKYMDKYVENLCREIEYTADIMNSLGKKLQSIYIGGGTPTSLSAGHLRQITEAISSSFSFENLLEYTCEAGRADTITGEKLTVLKNSSVSRISINPQTMNDEILKSIGRKHTASEFLRCYEMAEKMGFDVINTDVIAGLEGETTDSFKNTVDVLRGLRPKNITVHALTVKRAADLGRIAEKVSDARAYDVAQMVEYSYDTLRESGYSPYYMYRQKNTKGNLENVGYTLPGGECIYNVFIMSEIQSIIAVGAGASTKLVDGDRIERIFNYKFPYEYSENPQVWMDRKDLIRKFFCK